MRRSKKKAGTSSEYDIGEVDAIIVTKLPMPMPMLASVPSMLALLRPGTEAWGGLQMEAGGLFSNSVLAYGNFSSEAKPLGCFFFLVFLALIVFLR
ncbi:hypothetical protein GN244_ATG06207 [Phytophthora infestans]|uniref:Uncharacterized protein n=1 Tax=Phytophthora infestans TaxID=4787 RepID=A0A833TEV9_PHYIN|nr:hypothetical protein GN244_ATG06207 [Phytophthora infestans]